MEDAKLQALHDTLSQIRGRKGLGTSTQYSWHRGAGVSQTDRHPAALHLPDNALYSHFLPEGVYDPLTKRINDIDGRIKRDFSDAIMGDNDNEKERRKEIRKAEKKAAKKAEKLKAKILKKKELKKLEKKLKKEQSSKLTPENIDTRNDTLNEVSNETKERTVKVKSKKIELDIVDGENEVDHHTEQVAKKRKKSKGNASLGKSTV